jgi:hypothetical protein
MLDRCDRVQVAVADRKTVAERYRRLLGAEIAREDRSALLGARRLVLAVGESEIELCEPDGAGRTHDFLTRWGESIMTAGYSTVDIAGLTRRLDGLGVSYAYDGPQLHLGPPHTPNFPMVITPGTYRVRVGLASFLYETTSVLVTDWRLAAAAFTSLFDLDPTRFSKIGSKRFGYEGTLTLFDPPNRLDRIEPVPTARWRASPRGAAVTGSTWHTSRRTTGQASAAGCWRAARSGRRAAKTPPARPMAAGSIRASWAACCWASRAPARLGSGRAARIWCRRASCHPGRLEG